MRNGIIFISSLIIPLFLILLLLSTQTATAKEMYVDYIPGPLNGKCEACHSGASLDDYGEDFGSISGHSSDPQRAIDLIANMDSDGDGYINSVELKKGTFPGDPDSFPKSYKDSDVEILPIAVIGTLSLFMAAIIIMYNKGYIFRNKNQEDEINSNREKRDISIADDRDNRGLKTALKNLEKDFRTGTLDEETYFELKRIYKNKIYK
jgi:hypothetical protein